MGRVARFVHESFKRLVNASPLATLFDRPLHLAAVPEAKQSNQNVLSFQLGSCSAIIPPEFGAAGILEAPIFPSRTGSGGAHKANRFLARLFFWLFERLLFFRPRGFTGRVSLPGYGTLRVQVPNNHIRTQNVYYTYYYSNTKYPTTGYMDP